VDDGKNELRKLAEAKLATMGVDLSALSSQDSQELIHELRTHQIELEMQNEELRRAEQELTVARDRFADLYDFAPVGYLTFNTKGCITDINLTGAGMLGVERARIIDQPMSRWLAAEYRLAFMNHLDTVFSKREKVVVELKLKGSADQAGLDVQLESTLAPASDGEAHCRSAMFDITAHKQYEAQLTAAKEIAELANQAKSQFLSRMSHEFRTPLNVILGFAQIMDIRTDETLQPGHREDLEQIMKGGRHMLELVSDLLDLAAIEANKLELHIGPVGLAEQLQDSLDIMQPLARQREITLNHNMDTCTGLYVQADPVRLKQVLLNLLSNAIKYNRSGGSVALSCEQSGADAMRISVTDTGPGIPEADIPALFEPFSQLYLNTYAAEGTGIGLAVTRQLVEHMGGQIGVTSQPGHGSTFWFELPSAQFPAQVTPDRITPIRKSYKTGKAQITMLYIEDSPSHIQLIEAIVNDIPGLRLLTAHTPILGLEMAQAHQPDIIVVDICLPGMDGFEVLEQLRAAEATREISVMAVSSNAMAADIEKALRAGFRRYLTKPIDITEFRKAVDELVLDSTP